MRKQEYIHLHGLLTEVKEFVKDNQDLNEIELDEYEEINVKPTSVHKSKTQHKEALQIFATELSDFVENLENETPPTADD